MPITQTVSPALSLFSHTPRPPKISAGEYIRQRRFGGGHDALVQRFAGFMGTDLHVSVFRDACSSTAQLIQTLYINHNPVNTHTVDLTADELQTLACALLDAAHDLRSQPAISREAFKVPA